MRGAKPVELIKHIVAAVLNFVKGDLLALRH